MKQEEHRCFWPSRMLNPSPASDCATWEKGLNALSLFSSFIKWRSCYLAQRIALSTKWNDACQASKPVPWFPMVSHVEYLFSLFLSLDVFYNNPINRPLWDFLASRLNVSYPPTAVLSWQNHQSTTAYCLQNVGPLSVSFSEHHTDLSHIPSSAAYCLCDLEHTTSPLAQLFSSIEWGSKGCCEELTE